MKLIPNASSTTTLPPCPPAIQDAAILTDSQLYQLCRKYGCNARFWMRKFAGLLPEVQRRELYKKRGFHSIYEFAAKLSGMSRDTVDRILQISEKLHDKPALKNLFEKGITGWSKLKTVAYVATPETDQEWAERVQNLPQRSLEAYIQASVRTDTEENSQLILQGGESEKDIMGSADWQIADESAASTKHTRTFAFPITSAVEAKLRIFKKKFEKEKREVMSWNQVMLEVMKRLEQQEQGNGVYSPKSKKIVQICPECIQKKADKADANGAVGRYIPADVRKIIENRTGGKCEFPKCVRASEILHHTRRFALRKNHDPRFIRALCKPHEGVLQAGLVENEEDDPSVWKIRAEPDQTSPKFQIDQKVRRFRIG